MFDHVQSFYQPATVPEAVKLLQRLRGGRVVSGATDLAVQADRSTRFLIDVTRLGLNYIKRQGSGWAIGATTTLGEIGSSPKMRALANGTLTQAIATCGSVQLRNLATIGGNLANASPAADTATPLLALNAEVVFQGAGKKKMALAKFFSGPRRTVLNRALLIDIHIPDPPSRSGFSFQKLGRTETDISLVNVAAGLSFDKSGKCTAAQIALGAVGPTPIRASAAEKLLVGRKLSAALLDEAAAAAKGASRPISDVRASAEYRREMVAVLTRRALTECAQKAGYAL